MWAMSDRSVAHGRQPMLGRDPGESHRVATTLELLFDLIFVVAISLCGSQLAHAVAEGHAGLGVLGFIFGMFGILWAWMNYAWFASAFDTDDWAMRVATLVQMVGVLVLGLGQAPFFASLEHGHVDNRTIIGGYVIMRISMVYLWLRVAREAPAYAEKGRAYAKWIVGAQLVWIALAVAHLSLAWTIVGGLVAVAVEFLGLYWVQSHVGGANTPWHPHHITERYGLLVIIALGEVILGTTTAVDALIEGRGWSVEASLIAVAGIALAVGVWWCYFAIPWGALLSAYPRKGFGFGYGHMPIYALIAAIGSGLHVTAYVIADEAHIGALGATLAIAVPTGLTVVGILLFATYLLPEGRSFHRALAGLVLITDVAAVGLAAAGVPIAWCLGVVMVSPWLAVAAFELRGHQHLTRMLDEHGIAGSHS